MESAAIDIEVDDMMTGDHFSWQDVYVSYGCSLELDISDDDG